MTLDVNIENELPLFADFESRGAASHGSCRARTWCGAEAGIAAPRRDQRPAHKSSRSNLDCRPTIQDFSLFD